VARDRDGLAKAVDALGSDRVAGASAADLADPEQIARVAGEIARRCDAIDILVNNAAAVWNAPFDEFPLAGWDKVMDVNARAPFFLTQALLPSLRAAAARRGSARVINIASADALHVPLTETYSYTAAKAGLLMLTRMWAKRLGPERITVNAIAPGAFPTRMTARRIETHRGEFESCIPLGRLGSADDIAGAAVYLASRAGDYVNGIVLPVDGGWTGAL
jgi:NAD(P)-dependent dehydrogenase (short-subunit alcohol dehydrogenase family)